MKTWQAKHLEIKRNWWIIDASDVVLGRLSTQVANLLRGKNKPTFTPNQDTGDFVIVTNSKKVKLTGKKLAQKTYYSHSLHFGSLKKITADKLLEKKPNDLIYKSVKGMLPDNRLSRQLIKKLKSLP